MLATAFLSFSQNPPFEVKADEEGYLDGIGHRLTGVQGRYSVPEAMVLEFGFPLDELCRGTCIGVVCLLRS